jgi:hypothetical protein
MEHADLNASIDRMALSSATTGDTGAVGNGPPDELLLRRLKKRRLALRDQIARLQSTIDGKEPA